MKYELEVVRAGKHLGDRPIYASPDDFLIILKNPETGQLWEVIRSTVESGLRTLGREIEKEIRFAQSRAADRAQERYKEDIPIYGHLMTREEWLTAVKEGALVDYDGMGCASNGKKCSREYVVPSKADELPADATHVVWFNR